MKRYIAILTMVLAVAACKKQGPFEAPTGIGETLTAHIGGPESKVSFDASTGKFAWSEPTDEIALHTSAGTYQNVTVQPSGVFTFLPEGSETRDGFAFYPSGVAGGTAAAPVVTLPASYDIDAEGMGDWYPTPMIAVNDPASDDLWFYHVGGALRLTLNSVPGGTAKLVICMGKGITGSFDVADPETETPTIAPAAAADELTYNFSSALEEDIDGLILNIPLPTGTYSQISVKALDDASAELASASFYKDWVFSRARARQVTFDLATSQVFEPHPFSVSSVKTVTFAPGNLQYVSGWKFAEHQYDVIGYVNDSETDMLSWSRDAEDEFADWTAEVEAAGLGSGWRTLSYNEMRYLLGEFDYLADGMGGDPVIVGPVTNYGRNGGNPHALRAYATIYTAGDAAIEGLLILPDDWATPAGCREVVCGRWESSATAALDNTYNAGGTLGQSGDWAKMEAAGAIFLPAAGSRFGASYEPGFGAYWTATYSGSGTEIETVFFAAGLYGATHVSWSSGCAVRLAKDYTVGSLENLGGEAGGAGEYGHGSL